MIQKFQETERIFVSNSGSEIDIQNIDEFILANFKIPDDNLSRICEYITTHGQIENIIRELPNLIDTEFPNDEIQIKFYDEFQEQELRLEIGIFTSFDVDTSLEKEERLERKLFELYKHSADNLLLMVEFQND